MFDAVNGTMCCRKKGTKICCRLELVNSFRRLAEVAAAAESLLPGVGPRPTPAEKGDFCVDQLVISVDSMLISWVVSTPPKNMKVHWDDYSQ